MLLTAFPDLGFLKKEIDSRFADGKGWPNVVLNAASARTHRPDIRGPLSIFMNISGSSICAVNRHSVRIEDDTYFLTNRHEHYTLDIENPCTETFNIHFGEQLMEDVFRTLTSKENDLLDDPSREGDTVHFFTKLYHRDKVLDHFVKRIIDNKAEFNASRLLQDELLTAMLRHLLYVHKDIERQVSKLPPVKLSTREEVYRRLSFSIDYIHSYYDKDISLEELGNLACMSRFHYLRSFKAAFSTTPYAYLNMVRIEKAKRLLVTTSLLTGDISVRVGFENVSSFCRAFYRCTGQWPQQYRERQVSKRCWFKEERNSNFGK